MRSYLAAVAGCGIALAAMTPAQANTILFGAGLGPDPGVVSDGTGFAEVWWDTSAHTMRIDVTFSGLTSVDTAAHIHCCVASPGTAGVATALPTFFDFPLGVTSGMYDWTFDMTDPASYNPAFIADNGGTVASAEHALLLGMWDGLAYLNIHTEEYPGGEIRGFLYVAPCGGGGGIGDDVHAECVPPMPEPASLSLLAAGLAGMFGAGAWLRKRG